MNAHKPKGDSLLFFLGLCSGHLTPSRFKVVESNFDISELIGFKNTIIIQSKINGEPIHTLEKETQTQTDRQIDS